MKEALLKVELVAHTPKPVETIGRAGGICYDKEDKESYGNFVRSILKRGHESVIEHATFTFRISGISRALTHQLVRHRIASYSQRSQRYCKEDGFGFVIPLIIKSGDNETRQRRYRKYLDMMVTAQRNYNELIEEGLKPEDARFVLPNAIETRIVVTMNARSLRNFFKLRLDTHVQWEIRRLAIHMYEQVLAVAGALFEDMYDTYDTAVQSLSQHE